ncbi:MAG: PAS domain-containing sensor histidine kinase [Alphaproteobacteria bacterium]
MTVGDTGDKNTAAKNTAAATGDLIGTAGAALLELAGPTGIANPVGEIFQTNQEFRQHERLFEPVLKWGTRRLDTEFWAGVVRDLGDADDPVTREVSVATKTGPSTYMYRFVPLRNARKELAAVACTAEEHHGTSALRRVADVQERFEDLARLVSDWLWECDHAFNLTFVSARVTEALDMHPLELRGRNLFELGRFRVESERTDAAPTADSRSPFRDELFEVTQKDGGTRLFKLSGLPVFDEKGNFQGYRGTAKDITSETEAWDKALRSQQRLIDAIESISDGFALFDRDERLVLCNSRMREIYKGHAHLMRPGSSYAELARASLPAGTRDAAEDTGRWLQERRRQMQHGGDAYEARLGNRWLRISEHRTGDRDTVSIRTDITVLKEREQALLGAKEEAELANRTKTEFLANMSHELRTPLNAIIGFAEIMRDGIFGELRNKRYIQYVGDIHESARHLLNIINDILDVSKAEAGKLELAEDVLSVTTVIESTVRLVQERATQAEIVIEQNVETNLPEVYADERKIKQILLNLLSNAIKFTPAGGKVAIEAAISERGNLTLSVIDTGVGMDDEQIKIALTPFGQVDSAFNRSHDGTGLGLPLCKAIAELHGGALTIFSTLGEGTSVQVELPAERLKRESDAATA